MGVIIPQVVTSDRASGALSIDGSLKFQKDKSQYLIRVPSSAGDRDNYTGSVWIKRNQVAPENNSNSNTNNHIIFSAGTNTTNNIDNIRFYKNAGTDDANKIEYSSYTGSFQYNVMTYAKYRDTSGWYNVVWNYDGKTANVYVNGELVTEFDTNTQNGGSGGHFNNTVNHVIGRTPDLAYNGEFDGYMSQFYWVDGLTLGPSYFGYPDQLTGTWRPKRFRAEGTTVNDGTEWTTKMSNTSLIYSGAASNIFNGNITPWNTDNYASYNVGTLTLLTGVNVTANSSIRIYGNWLADDFIVINGVNYLTDANGSQKWISPIGVPYPINVTSLALDSTPGNVQNSLSGVEIDGVIMKDSTTQNLDFGTNGFYLPFDGNTPIGVDQSGKGNDYKPVNFGGSTDITKATGPKPILNTGSGGKIARPGVFGSDAGAYYHTTSASNSGGKYVFEDQGTQPTFSFIRGATYVFDWSASSSHPIRFATAADAAGSTEYTDGTDVTGNVTTITVPHNAPDTLYYYCNVHNGMGNSISVTTDETKADPYAWKCVLALPLVGSEADESANINCTQSAAKTISGNGGAAASSVKSDFYGGSFVFDGDGDYLSTTSNISDFQFGTGDFTIEAYILKSANGTDDYDGLCILGPGVGNGTDGYYFEVSTSRGIYFIINGTSVASATFINTGKWTHVAATRSSGTVYLFIDGILQASGTVSGSVPTGGTAFNIGREYNGSDNYSFNGYIQDFRVYKGVAKYTASAVGDQAFIPASTNPDIPPETPSGVAVKSKLTEITEGSVSFDGSGDYLATYTSSSELTFGTGDFTIEMFLYNEETAGKGFIQFSDSEGGLKNTSSGVVTIHKNNGQNGAFRAYAKNTSTGFSTPVPFKRWCHVALVRESGTIKLFVDGKQDATTISSDTTDYATTYVVIGGYYDTGYLSKCSISNVRVNKGTAVYTKDFKPPTRQLTNISGTKLLCCHSNSQPGAGITAPNMGGVNSGVQWSAGAGPNFEAANPARDGFNGKANSNTRTANANVTATVNFPTPVAFSSSLKVRGARDSGNGTIKLIGGNGIIDVSSQFTSSSASLETVTITGVTSPLKGISLTGISGAAQPRFSAIYIDDVMLVDPLTPYGDVSVSSNDAERSSATPFNPFTTDINTVRGQEGSYVTWNPNDIQGLDDGDLRDGNLSITHSPTDWLAVRANKFVSSGKWYYEVKVGNNQYTSFGVGSSDYDLDEQGGEWINVDNVYGFYPYSGKVYDGSSARTYATADTSAAGNVYGVAIDMDAKTLRFYENGKDLGVAFDETFNKESVAPMAWLYDGDGTDEYNFGQKPFKFPPPPGFQPLTSTTIRPETVIVRPEEFVGVSTYVGNESTQLVNNFNNMQPDLVWIKNRDDGISNMIYDSVRGANNYIRSDTTNIQDAGSSNQVSFNPKGFTVTGGGGGVNDNNKRYISWTWKAGGNKGTFNVDDIGYANASDVGMNIGGQNDNAYDQSQTWSNFITGTVDSNYGSATDLFNGTIPSGSSGSVRSTNPGTLTLDISSLNVTATTVKLYTYIHGTPSTFKVNGIDVDRSQLSGNGDKEFTIHVNGRLNTIAWSYDSGSGPYCYMRGISVSGKLLVNNGVTPANAPSIASTGCSVGTKQGFSIVRYTGNSTGGATVAHGLSQTPDFVIVKQISGTDESWRVRHSHSGDPAKTLYLNQTVGNTSNTEYIFDAGAATITLSSGANGINSGSNYIVYSWHDVPGLQKFGHYLGNARANGPFIELGFRPALVVLKKSTEDGDPWIVYDATRNTYNLATRRLQWNNNSNESMSNDYAIDILSNGFKIRTSDVSWNDDGERFIYMAWAEAPTYNLFGAQSNAR